MIVPRVLLLGLLMILSFLVVACAGGSPDSGPTSSPQPSPAATSVTSEPTATATTAAASDIPTRPGPQPGVACPVAVTICQFAVEMETIIKSDDADAFFAIAAPVKAVCSSETATPDVSATLCDGAAPNEVRSGYWALQGGEGIIVSEAELRAGLARWFDAISRVGETSDAYGPGQLRIGAISCTRRPDQKSGECLGNSVQIHFTFINPQNVQGTGLPGQRTTFHVSASVIDGVLQPNGFGTVAPPNSVLSPRTINIQDGNGNPLLLQVYPWTH